MRYRTRTIQVPGVHVVDGIVAPVVRTEQVREPIPPRDWDAIALRAVAGLTVLLTTVSVVWSTVAIGQLLGGGAAAYLVAGTFDLGWLAAFALAFLVRHRPDRRRAVNALGWLLLAASVAAIVLEGLHTGGAASAAVGGGISAVAKLLWWTLDRATRPALSSDDAQWVAAQISQADATLAVAAVHRRANRAQRRAADELLAMEAARRPALPARPSAQVDPTPALDPESTRPGPGPGGGIDPTPQAERSPTPERTQADPAHRPGLTSISGGADPDLTRARNTLAAMQAEGAPINRDEFKRRMQIGTKKANPLWAAVDPKRQADLPADQTRTA